MANISYDEALKSIPKTSTWTKLTFIDRFGEKNTIHAFKFKVTPKNVATEAIGAYLQMEMNTSGAGVGFEVNISEIYADYNVDTNPLGKFPTKMLAKAALKNYINYAVGSKEVADLLRMAFD
jgi:hypothetical protein